jgi:hypothetical protein
MVESPTCLYHGSYTAVSQIDLSVCKPHKDFGRGFYCTGDKQQAEKFARIQVFRHGLERPGVVSKYVFHNDVNLRIKSFNEASIEWLDFVVSNRRMGKEISTGYDLVIGPVANDTVGFVLNQLLSGLYGDPNEMASKQKAIEAFLADRLKDQYFFATQKAIDCLTYIEGYEY